MKYIKEVNNYRNCLRFGNESDKHAYLKFLLFRKLRKMGFDVYTEAEFKRGGKADVLAVYKDIYLGFEILVSEKLEDCKQKIKKYPNIKWFFIRNKKDIEKL